MIVKSPFDPRLGVIPELVAACEWPVAEFSAGAPRGCLLLGFPGAGKTTVLDGLEQAARNNNWAVIAENATGGVSARFRDAHVPALMEALGVSLHGRRVTGVSAPQFFGVVRQEQSTSAGILHESFKQIVEVLVQHNSGVLITIDDLNAHTFTEFEEIFAAVAPFLRASAHVRVVATMSPYEFGKLPQKKQELPGCVIEKCAPLSLTQVRELFISAATQLEWQWEETALTKAVAATHGYPLLVQLIDHYCIDAAKQSGRLDDLCVQQAQSIALQEFAELVVRPLLAELSGLDLVFLQAVAAEEGPVKIANIVTRMGRSADTIAQYRRRLVDRGLLEMARRGWVDFALPGMRECLRQLH